VKDRGMKAQERLHHRSPKTHIGMLGLKKREKRHSTTPRRNYYNIKKKKGRKGDEEGILIWRVRSDGNGECDEKTSQTHGDPPGGKKKNKK